MPPTITWSFTTNPRGSTGFGTAFANAINHDYPGIDMQDLMRGVDEALATGYVDEDNLFVYGCSGGGILTSYIVGNTDRFRAASANCPIVNWMSAMGTSDASATCVPSRSRSGKTPRNGSIAHRSSTWRTLRRRPMLMTGENDLRTPMARPKSFYQALQYVGVPTVMIRFQEEWPWHDFPAFELPPDPALPEEVVREVGHPRTARNFGRLWR